MPLLQYFAVWAFVVGIIFIFLPVAVGVVLGIYESAGMPFGS
jgi:hypothetical protein